MRWCGATLLCVIMLGGCGSPLDRLDTQASRLIEERQALSFGEDAPDDPRVLPAIAPLDESLPTRDDPASLPDTQHLSYEQLPAQTRVPPESIDETRDPAAINTDLPALALDLEGVLAYALEHAPDYQRQKEDLFLTTLQLIIERHRWGPRFFAEVGAQIVGTPESGDYDTASRLIAELGVTQRLPYGGSVSASALTEYVSFLRMASDNAGPDETQATVLNLAAGLPLLRGAGVVAREDLIQAERDLIYATREFERFRREFLVDLASSYFDLLFQQRSIDNQERQLRNLERTAEQFRALANAGKVRGFEAERIEQRVLFERSRLLSSRERYANALDRFKITLGMETYQPLVIQPVDIAVPEPVLDPQEATATALRYRLDLQTVEDRVADARRGVAVAQNLTLPDLDLDAQLRIPTTSLRDRGGVDFDAGEGDYNIGATLGLPLDRTIEQANVRAALVNYERAQRNLRVSRDQVTLDVRSAIRAIEQARFTLQLQVKNVELAERRTLEVSLRRRSLGPRDVIEAQQDLVDARDARDRALADLRTAVLQFLLATGQMRVSGEGRWLPPVQLVPVSDPLLDQAEQDDRDMQELQQSLPEGLQGAARLDSGSNNAQGENAAGQPQAGDQAEQSGDQAQAEDAETLSPSERRAQRRAQRERERQAAEQAESNGE